MNYFAFLAPALQIAAALAAAVTELIAAIPGTLVALPPIRTYISTLHLEIDVSVKVIPPNA